MLFIFHSNFNIVKQICYCLRRIILNSLAWSSSCKPNDNDTNDSKQNQTANTNMTATEQQQWSYKYRAYFDGHDS